MAIGDKLVNLQDLKVVKDKIDGDVGNLKSAIADVRYETGIPYIDIDTSAIIGHYINNNADKTSANFNRSTPIPVSAGDIVNFTAAGYSQNVTMIALSNSAGDTFVSKVQCTDGNVRTYTYTVVDDGYIVVSWQKNATHELIIKNNLSNAVINNRVSALYNANALELAYDAGIAATKGAANMSATGKYISNSGDLLTSANFNLSAAIALLAGQSIRFNSKGYLTSVSVLAKDNGDNTYTPLIISADNDEHIFTYYALQNMNVVISSNINVSPNYVIYSSRIDDNDLRIRALESGDGDIQYFINNDAKFVFSAHNEPAVMSDTGHFINASGTRSAVSGFNISGSISISEGERIDFNAKGYQTNVSVLSRVNNDGTYTPLIVSEDDNEHTFSYFSRSEMNVVICTNNSVSPQYSIYSSRIDDNEIRIKALEDNWFAFATLGVIGDSLASGASNYSGGAADRPAYSWGKYIQRGHGIDVTLFSSGGSTTRSWLAQPYGLTALNNADPLDCYIIGLGVNDAYSLGIDYLGTIADVHVGSESQNADTYYGNYSKIIAAIKEKSPRAKIICLTNPRAASAPQTTFNSAIEDIVELYTNTYLVDLASDSFYTSREFKDTWYGAHSTAVGYSLIADNIYKNVSNLIKNNVGEFLDIQWIVQNHN